MSVAGSLLISILPFISVVICTALLVWSSNQSFIVKATFVNILILSAAQAAGFMSWPYSEVLLFGFADIYLIALYWLFTNMLLFANSLSGEESAFNLKYAYVAPSILTVLHILGFMTDGYRIEQSSPMHNDGELAILGDFYMITCAIGVLVIATTNRKRSRDPVSVSKNTLFLISLVPMGIVLAVVLLLSMGDYAISLVVIGPLIFIYTACTFAYLSRHKVINLSNGVRGFWNRASVALGYLEAETGEASAIERDIKRQDLLEYLQQNDYSVSKAARAKGINRSTFRRQMQKVGLSNGSAESV